MAVLEKIRNRIGVLISVVIFIALLSFILTDFLNSGKSVFFSKQRFRLAEIDGNDISIQDFQDKVNKLAEIYKFQTGQSSLNDQMMDGIREQTWQEILNETILGTEYKYLGLSVSSKELKDMVLGNNPHPIVQQIFTNPETHEFNRPGIVQFLKTMDQDQNIERKKFWIYIESEITSERIKTKFYNLIKKGLYVTNEQLKDELIENSKKVNVSFVVEKLSSIADSTIKIRESELKEYLRKHAADYEQEASRDIEYVAFEVNPSEEDFKQAEKWIHDINPEFQQITDAEVKQFINLKSDTPFNEKYFKKIELSDSIRNLYDSKIGTMIGPYFENNSFKIARLADIKNLPDSVRARHILIRPDDKSKQAYEKAKALADSLEKLVKKGANFAELAKQYSSDGTKTKGGDLGWFKDGAMVKPFNDACFNGKKGEITVVESQFGFHVIEITDKGKEIKKVQIGMLERKVEPSSATFQAMYQKASTFAGVNNTADKFDNAVKKENLPVKSANNLTENTKQIQGIEGSRELVRWVFKSEKNTVSPVMEFGNQFVVAKLSQVKEKGTAPLDQVRDQVELAVLKEKKAEKLIEKLTKEESGVKTIDELAGKLGIVAQTAQDITFNSYVLPNAGFEPNVIAASVNTLPDKLSKPIKGSNGVFVIYVTSVSETGQANPELTMKRLYGNMEGRVNYEAFNILQKMANVKDERAKFY
jgi:peptidyl-prolyl cis-trans isomerase D